MSSPASWLTLPEPYGAGMTLTKPTGRLGSSSRVSANSGSKYSRTVLVSASGSLAMLHRTTHGWFSSRATSSRIAGSRRSTTRRPSHPHGTRAVA
jgi:hypothetical protein